MERLAVFDDTPLASHLTSAGMEDWGIEDSPGPAETLQEASTALKPLHLSESSEFTREAKFRATVRSALVSSISKHEVRKFVEQFRYQLVSSNLLEQRPIYARWRRTTAERRLDLLCSRQGPWDLIKVPPRYWASGGGCIVILTSLLAWKSKSSPTAKLSLVAGLLVLLFLASCAKRRTLRLLHRKLTSQVDIFCHNAKMLDADLVSALQTVQRSDCLKPHIGAKQLRLVILSSLNLLVEQHLDAVKDCFSMCSEMDLQQYWDVYELAETQQQLGFVMNDDFIGFQGALPPTAVLDSLKLQFKKVHFLRRAFMCILLTAEASHECSIQELEKWTVVYDQLQQMSDLASQVSVLLTKDRIEEHANEDLNSGDKSALNICLVSQHIAARMDILTNAPLASHDYADMVDQVSRDLRILNQMWQDRTVDASYDTSTRTVLRRSSLNSTPSTPETLCETFESSFKPEAASTPGLEAPDRSEFMLELSNVLRKRF